MNLDLRNVNKGGITVEDVHGHFDVHEVNGPVEMKGMAGSGDVQSVNGGVHVAFSQNPSGPCTFKTVNGAVEVDLKPGLSADLQYKTLHGGIFTDFDLSADTPIAGRRHGRARRTESSSTAVMGTSKARVGNGGPLLSFETVNGEIRIRRKYQRLRKSRQEEKRQMRKVSDLYGVGCAGVRPGAHPRATRRPGPARDTQRPSAARQHHHQSLQWTRDSGGFEVAARLRIRPRKPRKA